MKAALKEIFNNSSNKTNIKKSTLKALKTRHLIDDSCCLTQEGWLYSMCSISLKKQCEILNLDIQTMQWQKQNKPEAFALNHFAQKGYIGSYCELGGLGLVLKGLSLDAIAKTSVFKDDPEVAYIRACLGGIVCLAYNTKEELDIIFSEIYETNKSKFLKSCEDILSFDLIHEWYPGLTLEFAEACFDAISKTTLIKLASWVSLSSKHRNGWPDLTLIKDQKLTFIEIKTSDKLHESQLVTIPALKDTLQENVSILKLVNQKKQN